jgi:hypothetical protein
MANECFDASDFHVAWLSPETRIGSGVKDNFHTHGGKRGMQAREPLGNISSK